MQRILGCESRYPTDVSSVSEPKVLFFGELFLDGGCISA